MHGWFGIEKFVAETHSPPYHHCWLMMTMVMIMMSLRDIVCIFLILTTNRNRNCPVATGTERERESSREKKTCSLLLSMPCHSLLLSPRICLFVFFFYFVHIYILYISVYSALWIFIAVQTLFNPLCTFHASPLVCVRCPSNASLTPS